MTDYASTMFTPEYHSPTETYHLEFDITEQDPSTVVVLAVLDLSGGSVDDLDLNFDSLDPECLDDLFRPRFDGTPRRGGQVVFEFSGYEVTIDSSGELVLDPLGTG